MTTVHSDKKEPAPSVAAAPNRRGSDVGRRLAAMARTNILLLGLVLLALVFQAATGVFLTSSNLLGVSLDSSILLIVAVPAAMLLIAGYVDLSVGSTLGLGGVLAGSLMMTHGLSPGVAVLCALVACAAVGLLNGVLITVIGFSPLIVTLGTLSLVYGVSRGVSDLPTSGFPDSFTWLGAGKVGALPVPAIIAVVVAVLGMVFVRYSSTGRHIFAIGANPEAAFLSGLRVVLIPLVLYVVVGAVAGFGGVISASRLSSASSGSLGSGFEITVLTALLLGGISFSGGRGSIGGVVIGVLFLGVLQNGVALLGIPSFWQSIATGGVLIFAAGVNYLNDRSGQR